MSTAELDQAQRAAEEKFKAAFRSAAEDARGLMLNTEGLRPRGIIIPAGGARLFTCAWVAVRMLRDFLKTDLPIQIWHIGPREMSPAMIALMAEQEVETVDALALIGNEERDQVELGGFELKSFALLRCAFREVILLDADNVPLIDPGELFAHETFAETGAIFWPDLISITASSRIWDLCDVAYRQMPSLESGQMAIDRVRHYPALSLSWFLNRNSRIIYRHIYGDKDSFLIAWMALGSTFHLVLHAAKRLYGSICQHHPDGRRMFQHRNGRKWVLHGDNPEIEKFHEEKRCLSYLSELRSRWTGRIFRPPPYDEEMTRIAEDLTAQRFFSLETVSVRSELVVLLRDNLVLRRGQPVSWWLSRDDGCIVLLIGEDAIINRRFHRHASRYWRSVAMASAEQDLILVEENDPFSLLPKGHSTEYPENIMRALASNYDRME
jgi:hypothetical protein